jgi:hypothetical protein
MMYSNKPELVHVVARIRHIRFVRVMCIMQAPYTHRARFKDAPSIHELPDPSGYEPVFLWLLSRHGSRW